MCRRMPRMRRCWMVVVRTVVIGMGYDDWCRVDRGRWHVVCRRRVIGGRYNRISRHDFRRHDVTQISGCHATCQQSGKPEQEDITNDFHDSSLFFRFGKVILPCFSDKSQELSQNKNPLLRRRRDFGIILAVFTPRSGGEIGRHACLRCMWRDPCGFESRPEHHVVGYSSGQRGQTVNLLACAFGGSNPPPTTNQNHTKNQ